MATSHTYHASQCHSLPFAFIIVALLVNIVRQALFAHLVACCSGLLLHVRGRSHIPLQSGMRRDYTKAINKRYVPGTSKPATPSEDARLQLAPLDPAVRQGPLWQRREVRCLELFVRLPRVEELWHPRPGAEDFCVR